MEQWKIASFLKMNCIRLPQVQDIHLAKISQPGRLPQGPEAIKNAPRCKK
jgi:hypothetical protein